MSQYHLADQDSMRLVDETRSQAGQLLRRLMIDQRRTDERFAQMGRRDPIKALTGFSALERAVASTRDMICRIDQLLSEIEQEGLADLFSDSELNGR